MEMDILTYSKRFSFLAFLLIKTNLQHVQINKNVRIMNYIRYSRRLIAMSSNIAKYNKQLALITEIPHCRPQTQ